MLIAQQKMRHRRHERAGENVGGDHREDDRHRQRTEEIARHAAKREQRHEGDADAKQRDRRRRHDLACAPSSDGGHDILAMLHVAVDVLDRDRRVVDQDADGQRKAAERHDVDGLAEQRKARSTNSRTASGIETVMMRVDRQLPRKIRIMNPVSAAAITPSRTTALTEDLTKSDWSPTNLRLTPAGSVACDRREASLDAGNDVERGRRADLENRHQHALAPVELDDIGLRRRSVVDVGDVAHEDDRAVDHLDRQIVEVRHRFGRIVQIDGEFVGADLLRPDRIDLVLHRERVDDVGSGEASNTN